MNEPKPCTRAILHQPDSEAMVRWLLSSAVVKQDGSVWSWSSDSNPGHPYPEAAALWLRWASWRKRVGMVHPTQSTVGKVALRLRNQWMQQGGVGKHDRIYLFDSVLALYALATTQPDLVDDPHFRSRVTKSLDRLVKGSSPVLVQQETNRWSCGWHPHLLKAVAWLRNLEPFFPNSTQLAEHLYQRLVPALSDPFQIRYTHALCYALEGFCLLGRFGPDSRQQLSRLAEIQLVDGGLPAHTHRQDGPTQGDCTAQAVRLWSTIDPDTFAEEIEAGKTYLACQQSTEGAIFYRCDSKDRNTWTTLFAEQALRATQEELEPNEWI